MKVKVYGKIGGTNAVDPNVLVGLKNTDEVDNFSVYLKEDDRYPLAKKYVDTSVPAYLEFQRINGDVCSVVIYTLKTGKTKMSQEAGSQLLLYTSGQLSDGIGEGFEKNPCMMAEVNQDDYDDDYPSPKYSGVLVSAWGENQILRLEYLDD